MSGQAAPAGSFTANAFGLHETLGNVWEWVEDCRHSSYTNAPTDGSAWTDADSGDCGNRVRRGGSWDDSDRNTRSADRSWTTRTSGNDLVGLRIARTSIIPTPLTIHLLVQNAQGDYVRENESTINEGINVRWKAASNQNTSLTVTVRVDIDAAAESMGYNDPDGEELTFSDNRETSNGWIWPRGGNDTDDPNGTITLTLLRGAGYEIGFPSIVTVKVLDDDGDPQVFRDCSECPEMVTVLGGTFSMGSPDTEMGRDTDEGPQRTVTISPFAIGKYEVTFEEWEACVSGGGCKLDDTGDEAYTPNDYGWGRGRRPVVSVSLWDANQYVTWLSRRTGLTYRLLSEAQWEYAARAGTTTRYHWGDNIETGNANCIGCGGDWDYPEEQRDERKSAPVGSYAANAFGLYDMAGNVWEWVRDCVNDSYTNAPTNGGVWTDGDCDNAILRGGSFLEGAASARSANRDSGVIDNRFTYSIGFRIARASAVPPPPPTPDVNADNEVNANDALILYYSYSLRSSLGNGR